MKKEEHKNNGLGLFSTVWIGFSFIAGITFVCSFNQVIFDKNDRTGIGLNIIWLDFLEGVIAFICAWAFVKLVRVHPSSNGGVLQYSRTAFGKFWGLVGGIISYMSMPLITSALVVSVFKTNSSFVALDASVGWNGLLSDLIGIFVFILASSVIYFGTKHYKYMSNIIAFITWGLTIIITIFAIGSLAINKGASYEFLNNKDNLSNPYDLKMIAKAFTSIFFSFAGIETMITSGQTIKDKAKTLSKSIVFILIMVTAFYILFSILIIGATTLTVKDGFSTNPAISIFDTWDIKFGNGKHMFQTFGMVLTVVGTLLIRFNSINNLTVFGGSNLEPLSRQGFVPYSWSVKNERTGLPFKAIIITTAINFITLILFLIVPDIIQGVTGKPSPFTYAALASVSSIVLLAIYVLAIVSCLVQGVRKNIKLNVIEYIAFFFALAVIAFLVCMFFSDIIDNYKSEQLQNIVNSSIQLFYIVAIVSVIIGLYYGYHKKLMKNIDQYPEIKKAITEYEKVFTIIKLDEKENKKKKEL